MERKLIIDDSLGYIRAAIVEDGMLCEIHTEKHGSASQAESLFWGRVQAVKPSLHAAFVDIGTPQHAFLPLNDEMNLRSGDMLIVQGQATQTTETKGLRITHQINLAGRHLVFLPYGSGVHISKKIKAPELRDALSALGKEICPSNCGMIIRTAGEEVTEETLHDEWRSLCQLWQEIEQRSKGMVRPGLLYERPSLPMRLARDCRELSQIVTNSEDVFRQLNLAQERQGFSSGTLLSLMQEDRQLIFDAYNLETQIDKALKKRVWLPCGGYLIFDACEAMTVIDVNSGKMVLGRDLEETAFRVNMEAAEEIARQMRLRDIGGIILVDFIDMRSEKHKQEIVKRMKECASADRTQVSIEGLTRLGLMEITRKRKHEQLRKAMRCSCSYCSGVGEVLSGDETARRALRQVHRLIVSGQRGPFVIRCSTSAAHALCSMAAPEDSQVYCCAVSGRHTEKFDIEQLGTGMLPPSGACALK